MICKKCGTELDNDTVFCPKCGEKVDVAVEVSALTKTNKKGYIKIIIPVVGIAVIGVLAFFIVKSAGEKKFAFSQIKDIVEAGETIKIEDYISLNDETSTIVMDQNAFDSTILGNNTIYFTVSNNGKEKQCTATVNVVDTVAPVIVGDSEIKVIRGDKIDWTAYKVEDVENLTSADIELSKDVDTSSATTTTVTLTVKDSSGNEGTKDVKITVLAPTVIEEAVLRAMDFSNKTSVSSVYVYEASNGVYMIQLDDDYVYVDKTDAYSLKTAAAIAGYNYNLVKLMLSTVGEAQDVNRINSFVK